MLTALLDCIPTALLLLKGRDNIRHGPFWLGKVGLVSNIILLCFTLFAIIMYSFPTVMPVEADSKIPTIVSLDQI